MLTPTTPRLCGGNYLRRLMLATALERGASGATLLDVTRACLSEKCDTCFRSDGAVDIPPMTVSFRWWCCGCRVMMCCVLSDGVWSVSDGVCGVVNSHVCQCHSFHPRSSSSRTLLWNQSRRIMKFACMKYDRWRVACGMWRVACGV